MSRSDEWEDHQPFVGTEMSEKTREFTGKIPLLENAFTMFIGVNDKYSSWESWGILFILIVPDLELKKSFNDDLHLELKGPYIPTSKGWISWVQWGRN